MRVLVLKTGDPLADVRARHGSFAAMFARGLNAGSATASVTVEELDVTTRAEGDALPSLDGYDGVIMTGSPAYVGDDAPWMRWGAALVGAIIARGLPFLGVCFGHQLLGRSLGADVGPNPRGREMGTVEVEVEAAADDPLFGGLPRRFAAQVTHRDVVRVPARGMCVLARAPHDGHHAVRVGPWAWSVQFHPEIDEDVMRLYLELRRDVFDAEHGEGASAARLAAVRPTPHAASLLPRFAELCRARAAITAGGSALAPPDAAATPTGTDAGARGAGHAA